MKKSLGDKRREIPDRRAPPKSWRSSTGSTRGPTARSSLPRTSGTGRSPSSARCASTSRPRRSGSRAWTTRRRSRTWRSRRRRRARRGRRRSPRVGPPRRRSARSSATLPDTLYKDREAFTKMLGGAAKKAGVKLTAPIKKAILSALSERDETAEICRDKKGNPEPDTDLRDTENVPLSEPVEEFFAREVAPHVPDAWIDTSRTRREGRRGGHRRLRDQLQPLLLRVRAAARRWRRSRRTSGRSKGRSWRCCGRWRGE